ncbi:hypothetical protein J7K18_05750 [bacterium]|nr:hypothetical protein [bacterium]
MKFIKYLLLIFFLCLSCGKQKSVRKLEHVPDSGYKIEFIRDWHIPIEPRGKRFLRKWRMILQPLSLEAFPNNNFILRRLSCDPAQTEAWQIITIYDSTGSVIRQFTGNRIGEYEELQLETHFSRADDGRVLIVDANRRIFIFDRNGNWQSFPIPQPHRWCTYATAREGYFYLYTTEFYPDRGGKQYAVSQLDTTSFKYIRELVPMNLEVYSQINQKSGGIGRSHRYLLFDFVSDTLLFGVYTFFPRVFRYNISRNEMEETDVLLPDFREYPDMRKLLLGTEKPERDSVMESDSFNISYQSHVYALTDEIAVVFRNIKPPCFLDFYNIKELSYIGSLVLQDVPLSLDENCRLWTYSLEQTLSSDDTLVINLYELLPERDNCHCHPELPERPLDSLLDDILNLPIEPLDSLGSSTTVLKEVKGYSNIIVSIFTQEDVVPRGYDSLYSSLLSHGVKGVLVLNILFDQHKEEVNYYKRGCQMEGKLYWGGNPELLPNLGIKTTPISFAIDRKTGKTIYNIDDYLFPFEDYVDSVAALFSASPAGENRL